MFLNVISHDYCMQNGTCDIWGPLTMVGLNTQTYSGDIITECIFIDSVCICLPVFAV
jgi:hypothetical protein